MLAEDCTIAATASFLSFETVVDVVAAVEGITFCASGSGADDVSDALSLGEALLIAVLPSDDLKPLVGGTVVAVVVVSVAVLDILPSILLLMLLLLLPGDDSNALLALLSLTLGRKMVSVDRRTLAKLWVMRQLCRCETSVAVKQKKVRAAICLLFVKMVPPPPPLLPLLPLPLAIEATPMLLLLWCRKGRGQVFKQFKCAKLQNEQEVRGLRE